MMDKIYLYKIANKINGCVYIGQTHDVEKRWKGRVRVAESPVFNLRCQVEGGNDIIQALKFERSTRN